MDAFAAFTLAGVSPASWKGPTWTQEDKTLKATLPISPSFILACSKTSATISTHNDGMVYVPHWTFIPNGDVHQFFYNYGANAIEIALTGNTILAYYINAPDLQLTMKSLNCHILYPLQ